MDANTVVDTSADTSWSAKELNTLLKLITEHKVVLFNELANNDSNEAAWKKITNAYNKNAFLKIRSQDCLKSKFASLKVSAKQLLAHPYQIKKYEVDDSLAQLIKIMIEAEGDEVKLNDVDENPNVMSSEFSTFENNALVDIVENYRDVVLHKVQHPSAFEIKDGTWELVTETFNKIGFSAHRTVDCLRNQFNKIKNQAVSAREKVTYTQLDTAVEKVVSMLNDMDYLEENSVANNSLECKYNLNDSENYPEIKIEEIVSKYSAKFTDEECLLLLKCLKAEKDIIFTKQQNNTALLQKKLALSRITKAFNNKSSQKMSVQALLHRFTDIKRCLNADPTYKAHVMELLNNQNEAGFSRVIKRQKSPDSDTNAFHSDDSHGNISSDGNSEGDVLSSLLKDNVLEELIEKDREEESNPSDAELVAEEDVWKKNRKKRERSVNFTDEESSLLVECVRAEKQYVFSKSNSLKGKMIRKRAWERIMQSFNKKCTRKRSTQSLSMKFKNMKKMAKDIGVPITETSFDKLYYYEFIKHHGAGISRDIKREKSPGSDTNAYHSDDSHISSDGNSEGDVLKDNILKEPIEKDREEESNPSDAEPVAEEDVWKKNRKKRERSSNFTDEESSLLVECVRAEKQYVFDKNITQKVTIIKKRAWERITRSFNKKSTYKRSTQSLSMRFRNIKKMASSMGEPITETSIDKFDYNEVIRKFTNGLKSGSPTYRAPLRNMFKSDSEKEIERERESNQSDDKLESDYRLRKGTNSLHFTPEESLLLVKCVRAEKEHVYSKDITSKGIMLKNSAWERIKQSFNKKSPRKRDVQCLRTRFKNMRRPPKPRGEPSTDNSFNKFDNEELSLKATNAMSKQPLSLKAKMDVECDDHDTNDGSISPDPLSDSHKSESEKALIQIEREQENQSDSELEYENRRQKRTRALNFTPEESSLLLECVRVEKQHVFSDDITIKSRAWERIKKSFNKKSPRKRTIQCLRTRFTTMKNLAKTLDESLTDTSFDKFENEELSIEFTNDIKTEPLSFENKMDDVKPLSQDDNNQEMICDEDLPNHRSTSPDPLSIVLNSDSGIDQYFSGLCKSEDKEVVKMQLELLNFQMETAKMERKRVEDAVNSDAAAQQANLLETSLRLRAARLQALAAEAMLPKGHPVLRFTTEEQLAKNYLERYRN